MPTVNRRYFVENVLPQIPDKQLTDFTGRYPRISFNPGNDNQPTSTAPVLMLVALTGTGKTTTLNALPANSPADRDTLPARRDLADFVVIPMAQVLLGERVHPVTDRVQRFAYTRAFAEHVPGGMAATYTWLHIQTSTQPLLSEGIRGEREIRYALANCPRWQIVELTLDPLTRLQRLSNRTDSFDRAAGSTDLDYLPPELHPPVQEHLAAGSISPQAVAIMRAEAQNYGLTAAAIDHPNYTRLDTANRTPDAIAAHLTAQLERMTTHA